tara:strand:+ start:179 stop:697 length:519 start_codon:yes stop_codon:yes gene_type:complete
MLTKSKRVKSTLDKFRKFVVQESKNQLKKQKKSASGKLLNSITSKLKVSESSFSLDFFMQEYGIYQDKGVSGTKKKYNTPFSYTTKKPPANKLDKWTIKRGIAPRDDKGRFITRKGLNFIIARSIFEKGIKPSLFFTKPFEKAFKKLPNDIVDLFALDVEEFIAFSLKNKRL